jgi:hypothetical protein
MTLEFQLLTLETKLEPMNKMPHFRWYEPRKQVVGEYSPLEKKEKDGDFY